MKLNMINDDLGIEKGALGVRYLIQYILNGKLENFHVVKNCLNEVRLWILITFYSNNWDSLIDDIPEYVLEDIFTMKPLLIGNNLLDTKEIDYGKGFYSKSELSYKEQFKMIRDGLVHGKFEFHDGVIKISVRDYQAIFDLVWLDKLTSIVLSNNRICLKKNMSDISILSLAPKGNYSVEEIQDFIQKGYLYFYRVTSLTGNPETIKKAIRVVETKDCTFDFIFQSAIGIIGRKRLNINQSVSDMLRELHGYFKEVEAYFNNHIKLELESFKFSDDLVYDNDFSQLSYLDKLTCLANLAKFQDSVRYNSINSFYLLELLNEIENNSIEKRTLFMVKRAYPLLLKIYANIYFTGIHPHFYSHDDVWKRYGAEARFVHAKNIYRDYLKNLNTSLKELKEYSGPISSIEYNLKEIQLYESYLEDVLMDKPYKDFVRKMRNSIVHNQVEFKGGIIRFFTTGQNIQIKRYSKKNKCFVYRTIANLRPIWEMNMKEEDFRKMLDDLFSKENIEVKVNISKYIKRSTYLK